MSGPIAVPALVSRHNSREAARTLALFDHVIDPGIPLAALVASTTVFLALCRQFGVDPFACLSQIQGHIQAGSFALSPEDLTDVTGWARNRH